VRYWQRKKEKSIKGGATGRVERIELQTMKKEKDQDDDVMSIADSVASLVKLTPMYSMRRG
jgi:hypothetical protein